MQLGPLAWLPSVPGNFRGGGIRVCSYQNLLRARMCCVYVHVQLELMLQTSALRTLMADEGKMRASACCQSQRNLTLVCPPPPKKKKKKKKNGSLSLEGSCWTIKTVYVMERFFFRQLGKKMPTFWYFSHLKYTIEGYPYKELTSVLNLSCLPGYCSCIMCMYFWWLYALMYYQQFVAVVCTYPVSWIFSRLHDLPTTRYQ